MTPELGTRRLLVSIALGAALWCSPSPTWAQEDEGNTLLTVSTVALVLTDVGFLGGDIYHGAEGRFMPAYGAWTQTLLIGPANIVMAAFTLDHSASGSWLALGISELVLAVWFEVHGIMSIVALDDRPSSDANREAERPRLRGSIAIVDNGLLGTLHSSF